MRPSADQYKFVPGWCSDVEATALQAYVTGRCVLEIGTWKGRSAIAMAATARFILAVDHFEGDEFAGISNPSHETLKRFQPYKNVVSLSVGRWQQVVGVLNRSAFDLIYYDADHTYEATSEFFEWAIGYRGTIALHDVDDNPNHAGVKKALVERFSNYKLFDRLAIIKCESLA